MGISKEERDRRFARGQKSARESIAAKEIFSLRLQPQTIEKIYEIAANRNMHASDLVRGWIEQCVAANDPEPGAALSEENRSTANSELIYAVRSALREELSHIVSELTAEKPKQT